MKADKRWTFWFQSIVSVPSVAEHCWNMFVRIYVCGGWPWQESSFHGYTKCARVCWSRFDNILLTARPLPTLSWQSLPTQQRSGRQSSVSSLLPIWRRLRSSLMLKLFSLMLWKKPGSWVVGVTTGLLVRESRRDHLIFREIRFTYSITLISKILANFVFHIEFFHFFHIECVCIARISPILSFLAVVLY